VYEPPAEVVRGLDPDRVRENLARVRERIEAAAARAGRDPGAVEICAATKYVPVEEMAALAEAGIELVGENRAQDLQAKVEAHGERFRWDFIGHLQSRKVKLVLPYVRLIHSVASDSVLAQLARHATPETEVLIEVNTSGEPSKSGLAPDRLEEFADRCPARIGGLMTMPPLTDDPERSRPYFAALRELAGRLRLARLSMGTTQDFEVAVEEGATIVRIGTILYR
jgi:pyridoxal phosphate enzyme (YggS family)